MDISIHQIKVTESYVQSPSDTGVIRLAEIDYTGQTHDAEVTIFSDDSKELRKLAKAANAVADQLEMVGK